MSRRMVRGLVVGFGVLVGLAPVAAPGQTPKRNWAEAMFSESGHNFGAVPRGAKVRHNFVLTNRYQETVTILDVRASCGCTTGRASAEQVAPGQSAVIEAEMDTRNFVGPKATTLTITMLSNSGQSAEARLAVSSNILADVVLNPGSLDFGAVARGKSIKLALTIERIGSPTWRAARLVASSRLTKVVDAQLQETERSAARVGYLLTVTLRPDAPAGVVRDELRVLTNDAESPSVPVLVTAQIQGDLTATPSLLGLGRAGAAGAQGRYLVRSPKPFTITAIQGNGDGFEAKADDAQRKTLHIIQLTYKPSAGSIRGDLRRSFKVQTDLPGEAPVELMATVRSEP